jgi:AraC-like DNA-binding protein
VGYEDAASFRRLFRRLAGMTPGDYRRKFQLPTIVVQAATEAKVRRDGRGRAPARSARLKRQTVS